MMQPALVFCLAQAFCSFFLWAQALPIATDRSEQLVQDGLNGTGDYQLNNYIQMLFTLRKRFLVEGCNGMHNGHRISPHFCEQTTIKISEALQPLSGTQGCDINFKIPIGDLMERAIGAELAIYKQNQTSSEHNYTVYIVHKASEEHRQILDTKTISMSKRGWQVFNIDAAAAQWQGPKAEFTVQVSLDFDGAFLSCKTVKSLFVLNVREDSHTVLDGFAPVVTAFTTTAGSLLYCKVFPMDCMSVQPSTEPAPVKPMLTDVERKHRRDTSYVHDYVLQIFIQRRRWKDANCVNMSFNGQPVSSHHCNTRQMKTFCALEEVENSMYLHTCDLRFNISVSSSEKMEGADLALYKLEEANATEAGSYRILVIHAKTRVFNQLVGNITIPATSTGWQVFHIDNAVTSLAAGHHQLLLRLVVSSIKDAHILSCSEISSMFVLNDAALRMSNVQLGGDQGSGVEQLPTQGVEIPDRQIYFPVLTLFVAGSTIWQPRFKRSTADIHVGSKHTPGGQQGTCEIQDHVVNLDGTIPGITVIQPKSVNVKRCSGQCRIRTDKERFPALSRATQCKPTSFTSLEILLQKQGVLFIDTLADKIVDNCSCA